MSLVKLLSPPRNWMARAPLAEAYSTPTVNAVCAAVLAVLERTLPSTTRPVPAFA